MKEKDALVKIVEVEEAIVGLRNDMIVHVYYKAHTEINVNLQNKMHQIFNELTGGEKCLFIYEADHFCSVTKEARDNAIVMEPLTPSRGSVVVVQNIAYRLIAEFYSKINKPVQPYKVVSKFEDGVKWLKALDEETSA